MPAAAVIPAPIRKTKVAVFKKLVVEFRASVAGQPSRLCWFNGSSLAGRFLHGLHRSCSIARTFTLRKLEC